MNLLNKVLNIFTGLRVEIGGLVLTVVLNVFLLHGAHRIVFLALVALYLLNRFRPQLFSFVASFAEPTTWPGYVAMAVAVLVAAHQFGGWHAALSVAFVFAIGDGRLFEALY